MRVFVASLNHETSSFSPIPTSRKSFEEVAYYRPENGVVDEAYKAINGYRVFIEKSLENGYEVYASTSAQAQPSGPCNKRDYEELRDEIINDLANHGPFDMAFFFLHGAQIADGYLDCEGDLLTRARMVSGDETFIGAELDLHGNVSQQMLDACDVLLACKNYPHTDFDERAHDLFELGKRTVLGEISPVIHFERVPMVGLFYTTEPKMAQANAKAQAVENEQGVLSVSLLHGFMRADTPAIGAGILYITDGESSIEAVRISEIKHSFFNARNETRSLRKSIDEVLAITESPTRNTVKPYVIADCCDNAGGGAGSDSTFILSEVLERGYTGYAFGLFWDPVVAQFAKSAGVGAQFKIRLGGKTGPEAGKPLDVFAKVLTINEEHYQEGIGYRQRMGLTVALEVAGNYVVVSALRGQAFNPSCFNDFIADMSLVNNMVVKSTQHFYAQFAPIAEDVLYCETPGSLAFSTDTGEYQHLSEPLWPFNDVDLELDGLSE